MRDLSELKAEEKEALHEILGLSQSPDPRSEQKVKRLLVKFPRLNGFFENLNISSS